MEQDIEELPKMTKKELIEMLDEMNRNIEKLPPHALISPINHYDFSALLILLSAILKSENKFIDQPQDLSKSQNPIP